MKMGRNQGVMMFGKLLLSELLSYNEIEDIELLYPSSFSYPLCLGNFFVPRVWKILWNIIIMLLHSDSMYRFFCVKIFYRLLENYTENILKLPFS